MFKHISTLKLISLFKLNIIINLMVKLYKLSCLHEELRTLRKGK
jgi:hypothetical protein